MKTFAFRIGRRAAVVGLLCAFAVGSSRVTVADDTAVKPADAAAPSATPAKSEKPTKATKAEKATTKKAAAAAAISPEGEAAAIEFAKQNHPELVSLLQGLKQGAPKEYQAALSDLDRAAERLSKTKDTSSERYEFQLTEWKMSSRARLLAARLAIANDPEIETELRKVLRDRLELRLSAQRASRDKLQKRLEKLDQNIVDVSAKMDSQVEKQLADLQKTVASKRTPKSKSKPAQPVPPRRTTGSE